MNELYMALLVIILVAHKMGDTMGKHSCTGGSGSGSGPCPCPCPPPTSCPAGPCVATFSLDGQSNPCITAKGSASATPLFTVCGNYSKMSGSYDPYADAIGQASANVAKAGIPPCANVVYGWGDCGNDPGTYYAKTVGAIADMGAFQKAVAAVCGGS